MPDRAAYQTVKLEEGGALRRVYGAREHLKRESHALVVQTTVGATAKHQEGAAWFTDLRRGRLNIYGGLLRFLEHLHRRGVAKETALLIPEWLTAFIHELWEGAPAAPRQPIPLELMRTGEHDKAA
jgi:hypothetical protein